jgi:hypothetical protein
VQRTLPDVIDILADLPSIKINLDTEVGRNNAWSDRKADWHVNSGRDTLYEMMSNKDRKVNARHLPDQM